jgi:hypothetical protein
MFKYILITLSVTALLLVELRAMPPSPIKAELAGLEVTNNNKRSSHTSPIEAANWLERSIKSHFG